MSFPSTDDLTETALDKRPKHSFVNKFGRNFSLAQNVRADVWDGGGSFPWPDFDDADITHIKSTNVGDTSLLIEIEGLDINFNKVVQTKQTDVSDGTTLVALDTPLIRAFRKRVRASTSITVIKIKAWNRTGRVLATFIVPGMTLSLVCFVNFNNAV